MIEAARLKRARRRMRGYFLGSGLLLAFIYLMIAAFVIALLGLQSTSYIVTLVFAAGVMAGGTYAIFFFGWLLVLVARRILKRQPIMEVEN